MAFKDPADQIAYSRSYYRDNKGALEMKRYEKRRDPKKIAQKKAQNKRYRERKKAERELKILEVKDTKDEFF